MTRGSRWTIVGFLMLALAGCASLHGDNTSSCRCGQVSDRGSPRAQLNAGYSIIYKASKGLAKVHDVFLVKIEADEGQSLVHSVSAHNAAIAAKLERVARDFPAVDIHLDPDPEIIQQAEKASRRHTLESFAPVVGKHGAAFQRQLLIDLAGVLNHEHFVAQATAKAESNDTLKTILGHIGDRYLSDYNATMKLLDKRYFKHNFDQSDS